MVALPAGGNVSSPVHCSRTHAEFNNQPRLSSISLRVCSPSSSTRYLACSCIKLHPKSTHACENRSGSVPCRVQFSYSLSLLPDVQAFNAAFAAPSVTLRGGVSVFVGARCDMCEWLSQGGRGKERVATGREVAKNCTRPCYRLWFFFSCLPTRP